MKKHGEYFNLKKDELDAIAIFMDDEIRETVHGELAPCEPEAFLQRYLQLDPEFEELLRIEFSIEV